MIENIKAGDRVSYVIKGGFHHQEPTRRKSVVRKQKDSSLYPMEGTFEDERFAPYTISNITKLS